MNYSQKNKENLKIAIKIRLKSSNEISYSKKKNRFELEKLDLKMILNLTIVESPKNYKIVAF